MRVSMEVRRILLAGGCTALTLLAGCADSTPTATLDGTERVSAKAAVAPTDNDIVLTLGGGGVFTSPIQANESGHIGSEFWDNPSDDVGKCNVGFYAVGTIDATCVNQAQSPKSYNNRGGYADGSFWAKPAAGGEFDPAPFMFSGDYAYLVTLKGSYAGEVHKLGWFTIDASGNRIRHEVPSWGAKSINSTAVIPKGQQWGLYIEIADAVTPIDYTDATGDLHNSTGTPPNQFALFAKGNGSSYLVGVEDNPEDGVILLGDDDFNDYMLSVEPLGATFVIGDVEAHALGTTVNFWGAQWWKNNVMSGVVSNGVASFKGYATDNDYVCGGEWSSRPGNSSNPPSVIPGRVLVIVTNTVLKSGPDIGGNIKELLIVDQDGGYGPNPGHAGNGPVTQLLCP